MLITLMVKFRTSSLSSFHGYRASLAANGGDRALADMLIETSAFALWKITWKYNIEQKMNMKYTCQCVKSSIARCTKQVDLYDRQVD